MNSHEQVICPHGDPIQFCDACRDAVEELGGRSQIGEWVCDHQDGWAMFPADPDLGWPRPYFECVDCGELRERRPQGVETR